MKKLIGLFASAAMLAGCASNSAEVAAAPTSPSMYMGLSCPQIRMEQGRLNSLVAQLSTAQDKKASNDAAMTTVSLLLFWPAAFAIQGDNANTQALAQAKGQRDAIHQAALAKGC